MEPLHEDRRFGTRRMRTQPFQFCGGHGWLRHCGHASSIRKHPRQWAQGGPERLLARRWAMTRPSKEVGGRECHPGLATAASALLVEKRQDYQGDAGASDSSWIEESCKHAVSLQHATRACRALMFLDYGEFCFIDRSVVASPSTVDVLPRAMMPHELLKTQRRRGTWTLRACRPGSLTLRPLRFTLCDMSKFEPTEFHTNHRMILR